MNNSLPTVAFGHFVMKVSDIDISYQFKAYGDVSGLTLLANPA